MTDEAKHAPARKTAPTANGGVFDYGFLFEANQRALERWFKGMSELSQEITQFSQNRLQEDMTAWSTLASCRNFKDALDCQRRFAEKATSQYSEEIGKLSRLMAGLAAEGLVSFPSRADKSA